uniref:Putative syntenin-1 n=1 Tax=Ixodes ricinus TaxID=34613 RepID=V5HL91_IXORI
MSLYPTLEDMKVDHMIQAQTRPMPSSAPPGAPAPSAPLPYALYPSSGAGEALGMGDKFQALYPTLDDYMGISLSRDLPPEMAALAVRPPAHVAIPQTGAGASRLSTMVAPISGSSVGLRRAEVSHGIREVVLCKDQDKKVGLRLESINKGIFVVLVRRPTALAAYCGPCGSGSQILTIDDEVVAGYSVDKVHNMIRKANPECIVMAGPGTRPTL